MNSCDAWVLLDDLGRIEALRITSPGSASDTDLPHLGTLNQVSCLDRSLIGSSTSADPTPLNFGRGRTEVRTNGNHGFVCRFLFSRHVSTRRT